MGVAWFWQAAGLFAVTNIDALVVLSLFYGRARAQGHGALAITLGQYLGFLVILAISAVGALGVGRLPTSALRYLGIIPILIGVRAGWATWRHRGQPTEGRITRPPGIRTVAGVTLGNGGDNIGVYIPAFDNLRNSLLVGYCIVFLVLVAVWCLLAHSLTGHARASAWIDRWGHVVYPIALIAIGTHILVSG